MPVTLPKSGITVCLSLHNVWCCSDLYLDNTGYFCNYGTVTAIYLKQINWDIFTQVYVFVFFYSKTMFLNDHERWNIAKCADKLNSWTTTQHEKQIDWRVLAKQMFELLFKFNF